jgi:polyisoprenyl-phosphate glycosyltransferase
MKKKKFTFLIPCYNSEKFIYKNSIKLIKKIKETKISYELIFINDASSDNTLQMLRRIKAKYKNISIISYKKNLGKSAALKIGLKKCKTDIVVFYDCDLPYFGYLPRLIKLLVNNMQFVTIDRRSIKSEIDKSKLNLYQVARYTISKIVNYIIATIFIKNFKGDTQSGLKGFYLDNKFKKQKFISQKFFLDAEIIAYFCSENIKITSIPIKYEISKQSSIKIFSITNFIYILELLKIILFARSVNS